MPTYHGSCHCGRITFTVEAEIARVLDCNCSLCRKKGALYHPFVEPEHFHLLSGEDALSCQQLVPEKDGVPAGRPATLGGHDRRPAHLCQEA